MRHEVPEIRLQVEGFGRASNLTTNIAKKAGAPELLGGVLIHVPLGTRFSHSLLFSYQKLCPQPGSAHAFVSDWVCREGELLVLKINLV